MNKILISLRGLAAIFLGAAYLAHPLAGRAEGPRQQMLFDLDWRFQHGDAAGAEAPGYDDSKWRHVTLPHDWMIEGAFNQKSPAGAGGAYLDGGIGWYRKSFTPPAGGAGKQFTLLFEGAYMNADVWLNGQHLGTHPYGFTSFYYDITRALKYNGTNVLAVKLNVQQPCCRWYSGAGIYRDVWLIESAPVHVGVWGTYVSAKQISATGANLDVQTRVENAGTANAPVTVVTTILDPDGKQVAHETGTAVIDANGFAAVKRNIQISQPQLWSLETPVLYKAVTQVLSGGQVMDETETPFGIRTIQFTVDKGFFLNGKHVQIQGVCDHHDLGALGAAVYTRGLERQLQILKSMGCNAIRTSHNPPAPALLELCDRMGFLVMDEAFDEWKQNKTKNGYGQFFDAWSERDITSMLERDRNHPSIVLWSIGNEIREGGGSPVAGPMAQRLVAICHREDPTRPVTSACPSPGNAWKFGLAKALDVFGVNYNPGYYGTNSPQSRANPPKDTNLYPGTLPMVGSETQSQVDTRGEYGLSVDAAGKVQMNMKPDHQVSCYDESKPGWATRTDDEFLALKDWPWVAGEFVWTGFDYLGEPTPYTWPSRSSYFGIVDLCGFPKDRYYQFKANWTSEPVVHILPHWTWPGFEGKTIPVRVFTNADSVELFLNGKSLGVKAFPADCEVMWKPGANLVGSEGTKPSLHLAWSVPYEPGELKAVATRSGQVVATDVVKTTGAPAKIVAEADRSEIDAGGRDLSYIKVKIEDKEGNVCPDAAPELRFSLEGDAADIAGLDDGDETNLEPFQGTQHRAFHGLALAILRSTAETGKVTLKVSAQGLEPAEVPVRVAPGRKILEM